MAKQKQYSDYSRMLAKTVYSKISRGDKQFTIRSGFSISFPAYVESWLRYYAYNRVDEILMASLKIPWNEERERHVRELHLIHNLEKNIAHIVHESIGLQLTGQKEHDGGQMADTYFPDLPQAELKAITSNYVLMMPEDVAIRIHGKEFPMCSNNVAEALKTEKGCWEATLAAFTSVKESPAKAGAGIDYESELDMNIFCKYARFRKDLLSS